MYVSVLLCDIVTRLEMDFCVYFLEFEFSVNLSGNLICIWYT